MIKKKLQFSIGFAIALVSLWGGFWYGNTLDRDSWQIMPLIITCMYSFAAGFAAIIWSM